MKSMIIKSAVALIAALPLFTACQGEPEVGTLLHPEEQPSNAPKVYINEVAIPTNAAKIDATQTPVGMLLPEDATEFYVRLNRAVENDVVVTVAEDAEAAAASAKLYSDDANQYSAMSTGAISFEKATVTIPAGKLVSSEPVVFRVVDGDALNNLNGKGIMALKVVDIKSAAVVELASDHNAFFALVNKKVTNFKNFSTSELESKTRIGTDEMTITFDGADCTQDLNDDATYTYVNMYNGPAPILCEFHTPQPLIGIAYRYGYYATYGPYSIEVLTSDDGQNWTSQTGGELEYGYTRSKVCVNFYGAVTCKYVKFIPWKCYAGIRYGADSNTPVVGELHFYKQ